MHWKEAPKELPSPYTDEIIVAIQLWTDYVWLNVRAALALCLVLILQSALATLSLTLKCVICTGNFLWIYKNDMQCISCSRLTYMANDGTRRLNPEVTQDNSGRQLSPTWKSSGTWYTCGKNFNAVSWLGWRKLTPSWRPQKACLESTWLLPPEPASKPAAATTCSRVYGLGRRTPLTLPHSL